MPMRCIECGHLCKDGTNSTCPTKSKCQFETVPVCHLAHHDGSGQFAGYRKDKQDNRIDLRIACSTQKPIEDMSFTPYRPAVTCLDCLQAIPLPEIEE